MYDLISVVLPFTDFLHACGPLCLVHSRTLYLDHITLDLDHMHAPMMQMWFHSGA